jgi:hypothetical protein
MIVSSSAVHGQFRKGTNPFQNISTKIDTSQNVSADQFLSPYFQTFTYAKSGSEDNSANNHLIQFSKPAKILLGMGADLIRGGTNNIPLYSFENAWKYPGPTVRYPKTATEYELFLERYQRYVSDSQ